MIFIREIMTPTIEPSARRRPRGLWWDRSARTTAGRWTGRCVRAAKCAMHRTGSDTNSAQGMACTVAPRRAGRLVGPGRSLCEKPPRRLPVLRRLRRRPRLRQHGVHHHVLLTARGRVDLLAVLWRGGTLRNEHTFCEPRSCSFTMVRGRVCMPAQFEYAEFA